MLPCVACAPGWVDEGRIASPPRDLSQFLLSSWLSGSFGFLKFWHCCSPAGGAHPRFKLRCRLRHLRTVVEQQHSLRFTDSQPVLLPASRVLCVCCRSGGFCRLASVPAFVCWSADAGFEAVPVASCWRSGLPEALPPRSFHGIPVKPLFAVGRRSSGAWRVRLPCFGDRGEGSLRENSPRFSLLTLLCSHSGEFR